MINESQLLLQASEIVKEAKRGIIRGSVGALYDMIGEGTGAAAKSISKAMGDGVAGKTVGGAIRLAPWAGGAYVVNRATGDPVGKTVKKKVEEFKLRRALQKGTYDPQTGMMYG